MNYTKDFIEDDTYIIKKSMDSLPHILCITNTTGEILYINKKGDTLFNCEDKKQIKNAYDLLKEYDIYLEDKKIDENTFPLNRTLVNGEKIENLILYFKKNNRQDADKYLSVSSSPLIEDEQLIGAIVNFYDITKEFTSKLKFKKEREKFLNFSAELKTKCEIIEILRNREKEHLMHLKDVMNNISEGILVYDSIHKLNLCNKSMQKMFELKAIDFVTTKKFMDKYYVVDEQNIDDSMERIYNEYIKKNIELKNKVYRIKDKNSKKDMYIQVNINPIFNEQNRLKYTIVNIKDITDEKIHEVISKKKSQFINDVVNTINVPIAVVNYPSLEYKLVNEEYKKMLKLIRGENFSDNIIGDSIVNVIPFLRNTELYEKLKYVGETGEAYMLSKYRLKGIDNKEKFYNVSLVPKKLRGKTTTIHIHAVDITKEINSNMILKKINRNKDEFFNVVSHELRTPLTIIHSSLQLAYDIYKKDITSNIDKVLVGINQNCGRLLKLVNNVFEISQAKEGLLKVNVSDFDIVGLTESIVTLVNSYANKKNISVIFDTNEEEYIISIDKYKYERILLNLLSNAIKFSSENKDVLVCLNIEKDYFKLSVKDEGVGIPKDEIDTIFNKFSQVNSSLSRGAEGTGLGLTIVKLLVDSMDGEIIIKTDESTGSEFTIMLSNAYLNQCKISKIPTLEPDINKIVNIEFSDIN